MLCGEINWLDRLVGQCLVVMGASITKVLAVVSSAGPGKSAKLYLALFLQPSQASSYLSPQSMHNSVPLTPQVHEEHLLNPLTAYRGQSYTTIPTDDLQTSCLGTGRSLLQQGGFKAFFPG